MQNSVKNVLDPIQIYFRPTEEYYCHLSFFMSKLFLKCPNCFGQVQKNFLVLFTYVQCHLDLSKTIWTCQKQFDQSKIVLGKTCDTWFNTTIRVIFWLEIVKKTVTYFNKAYIFESNFFYFAIQKCFIIFGQSLAIPVIVAKPTNIE